MIERPTFTDEYKQKLWEMMAYATFDRKVPYRRAYINVDKVVKLVLRHSMTSYVITSKVVLRFLTETQTPVDNKFLTALQEWLNKEHEEELERLNEI